MAKTLRLKNTETYIRVSNEEAEELVKAGTHSFAPKKGKNRPVYIE